VEHYLIPLPVGAVAPDFTLQRSPNLTLSLHDLAGHPVILAFYPAAWEAVSREQLALYQDFLPQFDRLDAWLLGIAADYVWCHESFAREARITFPLLSDMPPRGAVSKSYGVYREPEELTARGLFVIDCRGIVRFGEVYPDLLNPGVDDLLTVLEGLAAEENNGA
jgi:peroxiredoxin